MLRLGTLTLVLAVLGFSATDFAHAQTKDKGAIMLTGPRCMTMCLQRGYAGSEERCRHLCRPGCRNAATGERFCVK